MRTFIFALFFPLVKKEEEAENFCASLICVIAHAALMLSRYYYLLCFQPERMRVKQPLWGGVGRSEVECEGGRFSASLSHRTLNPK